MKNFKIALIAGLLATSALTSANADSNSYNDIVLKARVGYMNVSNKHKTPASSTTKKNFGNGFVGEIAADYFFTKNVAVEAAIGFGKTKLETTNATSGVKSKDNVTLIPVTATVQYHFSPSSEISPYAGLGYSYQIASGGPNNTKVSNGGGVVAQLGADYKVNDTFGINADVKYTHKASHDIKVGSTKFKGNLSTVTAMVGVTFPF